ncbi:MAG: tRNA adenosine(34) deaminase TadA [Lachnospiraceae bacterium]|nr:tRNA adenosine(34) deaminase TadA [Lachnospiraceae bacterium]
MSIREKLAEAHNKRLDEKYMHLAIKEARKAYAHREVPIGCVIVHNGKVLAKTHNRRNTNKNALAHAEVLAINKACKKMHDWRLEDCVMYITLEPCQMCSGAIVQSRIPEVVIGAMNPKAGCAGSVINILQMKEFNHQVEITSGVLEEECSTMLSDFFRELREEKKQIIGDRKNASNNL